MLGAATRRCRVSDWRSLRHFPLNLEYPFRLQDGYFGVKVLFVNKKRTKLRTGKEKAEARRLRLRFSKIACCRILCYTVPAALLRSPCRGKEVRPLEFFTFIETVAAQVVAYYLCTWIDSKIGKGSKH